MGFIRRSIPNLFTCGNLFCGCLAIVKAFEGNLVWAAYLVGIAAVLDFLDGFAARMLKVSSPIGKDLDSLADLVTFGVVPGVVMYQLLFYTNLDTGWTVYPSLSGLQNIERPDSINFLPFVGFLITIFSALRLAKFNNDVRQADSFIGLPTPANSMFICSLPLILGFSSFRNILVNNIYPDKWYLFIVMNNYFLITTTVLMSYLLVAELPLFALKFKHFKWKGNEIRFIFLGLSLLLIAFLKFVGIPLIIVLYVLLSVISNLRKKLSS